MADKEKTEGHGDQGADSPYLFKRYDMSDSPLFNPYYAKRGRGPQIGIVYGLEIRIYLGNGAMQQIDPQQAIVAYFAAHDAQQALATFEGMDPAAREGLVSTLIDVARNSKPTILLADSRDVALLHSKLEAVGVIMTPCPFCAKSVLDFLKSATPPSPLPKLDEPSSDASGPQVEEC